MDPNAALAELDELAVFVASEEIEDLDAFVRSANEMAIKYQALNDWLTGGGFLPTAWDPNIPRSTR